MTESDDEARLAEEIAAIARELETLPLTKAGRDRRLELNGTLAAKRHRLDVARRSRVLRAAIDAVTELAKPLGDAPADKARRRELLRERAKLQSELDELTRPQ